MSQCTCNFFLFLINGNEKMMMQRILICLYMYLIKEVKEEKLLISYIFGKIQSY